MADQSPSATTLPACASTLTNGQGCARQALFRVHWPGNTLSMCADCAVRAQNVAHFMGFLLTIDPLPQMTLDL